MRGFLGLLMLGEGEGHKLTVIMTMIIVMVGGRGV